MHQIQKIRDVENEREFLLTNYIANKVSSNVVVPLKSHEKGKELVKDLKPNQVTLGYYMAKFASTWKKSKSYEQLLHVMLFMAQAVQALHEINIVHLNLGLESFILTIEDGEEYAKEEAEWRENAIQLAPEVSSKPIVAVHLTNFTHATVISKREGRVNTIYVRPFHNIDYVSPEQTHKGQYSINLNSDIYSLGAVFYHMLVGVVPFSESSRDAIIDCHNYRNLTALRKHNEDIPIKLEQLVTIMMQKNPQERPDYIAQVVNSLKQVVHSENLSFPKGVNSEAEEISQDEGPADLIITTGLSIGRSSTLKLLERTFDRTRNGLPIFSLFRGSNGNGKFAMFENLAAQYQYCALFVAGTFAKRLLPFSPLIQIAKQILLKISALDGSQRRMYTAALKENLKTYERVLCIYLPELEAFLDIPEHEKVENALTSGNPMETNAYHHEPSSQLQTGLVNFFTTFCSGPHRLVIYMNNIENAGNFSLSVIELLLTKRNNLLFIGATSSQNTDSYDTPIGNLLSRLKKRNSRVSKLEIDTFPRKHVQSFVSMVLNGNDHRKLSDLIHSKSSGKPIIIQEMLLNLHNKGLFSWDASKKCYTYTYDSINAALPKTASKAAEHYMSENLALIQENHPQLADTMNLMSILARPVSVAELSMFLDKPTEVIFESLVNGLREGIIVDYHGNYRFSTTLVEKMATENLKRSMVASYQTIADKLVEMTPPALLHYGFTVFEIVKFYKKTIDTLENEKKHTIIKLCLIAASNILKAKLPKTASNYVDSGLKLVNDTIQEAIPDDVFRLHALSLRIQLISGNSREPMTDCETLLARAKTKTQRMHALELMISCGNRQNLYEKSYDTIQRVFEERNKKKDLSATSMSSLVKSKYQELLAQLEQFTDVESLLLRLGGPSTESPTEEDFYYLAALCESESIVWYIPNATKWFYLLVALNAAETVFKFNMNHSSAAIALGFAGHALSILGNTKKGYLLANAGLNLSLNLGTPRIESKLIRFQSMVALANGEQITEIRKSLKKSFTFAVETNDTTFLTGFFELSIAVCLGFHLTDIKLLFRRVNNRVSKQPNIAPILKDALVSCTFHLKLLKEANSVIFEPKYQSANFLETRLGRFLHPFFKSFSLVFVKGSHMSAFKAIEEAAEHIEDYEGTIFAIVLPLIRAAILGKCYDNEPSQRPHFIKILKSITSNMTHVNDNTLEAAVYYFACAEYTRCSKGDSIEILQNYQKAVSIAENFQFKLLIGFASERLVEMFKVLNFFTPVVVTSLRVAIQSWQEVGATRTIIELKNKYEEEYTYCNTHKETNISPIVIINNDGTSETTEVASPTTAKKSRAAAQFSEKMPNIEDIPIYYKKQLSMCAVDVNTTDALAGVTKNVTLLACGIRNFSKLIVHKSPSEVYAFLNNFFSRITPVLNKYNGYIHTVNVESFIAVFPESEQDAALAAVYINESLNEYNKERLSFGESFPVRVGIGIHRESAYFGLLHVDDSRYINHLVFVSMDKLNKMMNLTNPFGVSIIASHKIVKNLENTGALNYRFIGKFVLDTERDTPLQVYEVYNPEWIQYKGNTFKEFDRALQMFYQRKFISATNVFVRVAKGAYSNSGLPDHLARIYVKVCRMYKHLPLPQSWNGEVIVSTDGNISPFGGKRGSFYLQHGITQMFHVELSQDENFGEQGRSKDEEIDILKKALDQKKDSVSNLKATVQTSEEQVASLKKELEALQGKYDRALHESKNNAGLLEKEKRKTEHLTRRMSQLQSNRGLFSCFNGRNRPTNPNLRNSSRVTPVENQQQ